MLTTYTVFTVQLADSHLERGIVRAKYLAQENTTRSDPCQRLNLAGQLDPEASAVTIFHNGVWRKQLKFRGP